MSAQRCAFFLRGVNLGRKNTVRMADLRAVAAELGAAEVATHLASGNLLAVPPETAPPTAGAPSTAPPTAGAPSTAPPATSAPRPADQPTPPDAFALALAAALEERCGFAVPVVARGAGELRAALEASPFGAHTREADRDEAREALLFFASAVPEAQRSALDREVQVLARGGEEVWVGERHARIWYANGAHGSRLSQALFERRLGMTVTARNLRTLRAVAARLEA
ncbi:DUF1697 domain-containing protein [Brevibacterium sp. 5221]|uniref:DUF1697 domain-containing protein n=1 Tax=Brevibacterium rongguiense TaxID=2695267 RepID=A0A6N9H7M7_9MICO|nr:DUF1697 domain-containing protein [Brevibacterium rongguiense]MYM19776.1 DUF1697 domain-containing protein [Brevibacterium rongguiense]